MAGPASVLLIDDETHVRLFTKLVLRQLGVVTCYEAPDGVRGLALFREHRPDAVLMDVNMPGLDGIETLREILAIDPNANVIMLTAQAARQTVEKSGNAGAVQYIRKDTSREELTRILGETFAELFPDRSTPKKR